MRHLTLHSLLLIFSFSISSAQTLPDKKLQAAIDKLMKPLFKPVEPGMAILIGRKGKILYQKAFGSANIELKIPLQPDMVFRIGSVTKQFTATAVLQLAEKGRLQLQDSLQQYIHFPSKGHIITIRDLLAHTSGIRDYMSKDTSIPFIERHDFTPDQLVDHVKNDSLLAIPGTQFIYSNTNYVLLGMIIEKVTGIAYHDYVKQQLLNKAGMQDTWFAQERTIVPRRIPGYSKQGDEFENTAYQSLSLGFACGDLLSTVGDLFKWNEAIFKQGLLGKQMLDSALTPVKLKNGNHSSYGLGWMNQTINGKRCYRHDGSVMGFGAEVRYFPDQDIFMAFLVNGRSQETDARTMELINRVTQLVSGKPILSEIPMPASILQQYTGVYALNQEHKIIVTLENGQLFIEGSNPADQITKIPVYPYQPDHFFTKGPDFIMEFRKDNNGHYTKIVTTARSKFIFEWMKEK